MDTKKSFYKRKRFIIPLIIVLLLIIIVFIAFDNSLKMTSYSIESDKLNNKVKIVHISDLHNEIFEDNQQKLIDKVKNESPDLIVLTGDMADGSPTLGTELLLEGICDVAPMFYVTGNHEYPMIRVKNKSGTYENIISMMKRYGVRVLEDESSLLTVGETELIIAGINDPDVELDGRAKSKEELKNIFQDINQNEKYTILLAHRPEDYHDYMDYGFDLVLSGHTHGGQIRIPLFLNGLFAPGQGFFPERAGGLYKDEIDGRIMYHIVNRGTTRQEFEYGGKTAPRIFNPPEICVIELEPE